MKRFSQSKHEPFKTGRIYMGGDLGEDCGTAPKLEVG